MPLLVLVVCKSDYLGCGVCACVEAPLGESTEEGTSDEPHLNGGAAEQAIRQEAEHGGCHWLGHCHGCLVRDDDAVAFDPPLREGEALVVDWRTDVLEEMYVANCAPYHAI